MFQKTYGGVGSEWGGMAIETAGGGYIQAGTTNSFGSGGTDQFLIKTDAAGNVTWAKTYGTASTFEGLRGISQNNDGSFIMCGHSNNTGNPARAY